MKHLLDVSMLIALIWPSHVAHSRARAWYSANKEIALCPITELGFLRVSTSPAFNATMEDARRALKDFIQDESPDWIPDDIRSLDGETAPSSGKTTDWYLGNLATAHGMNWATLDTRANHPAALPVS
jgi:predicted nucleic acid-binding protein